MRFRPPLSVRSAANDTCVAIDTTGHLMTYGEAKPAPVVISPTPTNADSLLSHILSKMSTVLGVPFANAQSQQ